MPIMPQKKHKPEEIVAKLRQVDVLLSQGRPVAEANLPDDAGRSVLYGRGQTVEIDEPGDPRS